MKETTPERHKERQHEREKNDTKGHKLKERNTLHRDTSLWRKTRCTKTQNERENDDSQRHEVKERNTIH